jgi:hypothetical protein
MQESAEVEEIAGQILIAFGQGTGAIRVPRGTVRTMRAYFRRFAEKAVPRWGVDGSEVLERVRLMGRLAAQIAVGRGSHELGSDDFTKAADSVRMTSQTDICA